MPQLLDALFPEFCVRCGEEGSLFCVSCQAAWWPDPDLVTLRGSIRQHFSLGSYRDQVLQRLIGLWKFNYVTSAKEALLRLVAKTVDEYAPALPNIEAVTYVPLHWRKKNERGFDQAALLADQVALTLGLPCLPLLTRDAYTAQQAQIARGERQAQTMDGLFSLMPGVSTLPKRLLLVDDVWTTGATMRSAAVPLLAHGVGQVYAFTVAKG